MRKMILKTIFALVVCFSVAIHASAQTDQQTPEAVAKAYIEASINRDWAACAALMHPEALRSVRSFMDRIVAGDKKEKEVRQMFGVGREEYARMNDAQVYAGLVGYLLSDMMAGTLTREMLSSSSCAILGKVSEEAGTAHVVYRMHTKAPKYTPSTLAVFGMSYSVADCLSLKAHETTWRAMLSAGLESWLTSTASLMAGLEDQKKNESADPAEVAPEANSSPAKPLPKKAIAPRRPLKAKP